MLRLACYESIMTWRRSSWVPVVFLSVLCGACSSGDPPPEGPDPGGSGGNSGLGGGGGKGGDGDGDGDGDGTGGSPGTGGEPTFTCDEVTCLDTQTCEIIDGTARCVCLPGFGGDLCAQESLCDGTPDLCGPDADCIDSVGGYRCECRVGFRNDGTGCVDVSECDASPCASGADCTEEEGDFTCFCPMGEFGNGLFCKATDHCAGNPCGPHGSCVNTQSGFVCECDSGYEGQSSCTACSELAVEPALAAVIRSRVGLSESEAITPADVSGFTSLNARNAGISSLVGLECWTDLRSLDLANNDIDDEGFAVLSHLPRLEELNVSCNQLSTLEALEEHPRLRVLRADASSASCGKLGDIAAVGTLTQLELLSLDGQDLVDLSVVSSLSRLAELSLNYNDLSVLPDFSGLVRLTELYLAGNSTLTSVSGLASGPSLLTLDVSATDVNDLTPVSSQAQLTTLRVSGSNLIDLSPLAGLTQLRVLAASQNLIADLSPLSGLALQQLDLFQNSIQDIEPLTAGNLSGEVYLVNNPLSCDSQQVHLDTLKDQGVVVYGTCQ